MTVDAGAAEPTGAGTSPEPPGEQPRLATVVGRLSLAAWLPLVVGFVTGPLQARALGAAGRGDLAAILVPLGMVPLLVNLGVMQYAGVQAAQRKPMGPIFGSLAVLYLAIGSGVALLGPFIADHLAAGRSTVERFLTIGFALAPIALIGQLLIATTSGLQLWNRVIAAQVLAVMVPAIATVTLYAIGELTVSAAAVAALAAGVISIVPLLRSIPLGTLKVRLDTTRDALHFGVRAWVGSLASLLNLRIDQLIMVAAVPARELGLYVVAVTVASLPGPVVAALGGALGPKIAQGDRGLAPVGTRLSLSVMASAGLVMAAVVPWLLPLLFGSDFTAAVPMALILLAAGIPQAGNLVLTNALVGAERPGITSVAEVVSLGVTGIGLLLLLDPLGGIGAAIVSLVAYTTTFAILLSRARHVFERPVFDFVVPRHSDFHWLIAALERRPLARRLLAAIRR